MGEECRQAATDDVCKGLSSLTSPSPLTYAAVEESCQSGRLIVSGPLNDAYEVSLLGGKRFVRHRTVDDEDYGQTFAGERFLPADLFLKVRIPTLQQLVLDTGGTVRFAVFEYVEGEPPDWENPSMLDDLASVLLEIHNFEGPGYGDIGGPFQQTRAGDFIVGLIADELERLSRATHLELALIGRRPELARFTAAFEGELPRLCHGDVHAANFLADTMGSIWALDWEAARYRVPAADFNQLHNGWLSKQGQGAVLNRYLEGSGRSRAEFEAQIRILRLLWHLRTYNFSTQILGALPGSQVDHLVSSQLLFEEILLDV